MTGYDNFKKTATVSHKDIAKALSHASPTTENAQYSSTSPLDTSDIRVTIAGDIEQREMTKTLEYLIDGRIGYLPEQKSQGWV